MKKIAVAAVLGLVTLVGCSNDSEPREVEVTKTVTQEPETVTLPPEPAETVTVTPEPEPTPDGAGLTDEQFVEFMRSELGLDSSLSGATIVGAAREVCGLFDSGLDPLAVGEVLVEEGFPAYEAGFFMAGSVDNYCPEYNSLVQEFAENGGTPA